MYIHLHVLALKMWLIWIKLLICRLFNIIPNAEVKQQWLSKIINGELKSTEEEAVMTYFPALIHKDWKLVNRLKPGTTCTHVNCVTAKLIGLVIWMKFNKVCLYKNLLGAFNFDSPQSIITYCYRQSLNTYFSIHLSKSSSHLT